MKETTKISLRNHAMSDQTKQDNDVSKSGSNVVLCTIERDLLKRVYFSLEAARDNAAECYNSYMERLGETTKKNERLAKLYKEDLDEAEALIGLLSAQWKFGA